MDPTQESPPAERIDKVVASGKIVNLLDLRPEDINAWDVAWALHNKPRYDGACPTPWTVLSHTMLCLRLATHECGGTSLTNAKELDRATRLAILLHDSSEGYLDDMNRWLKERPEMAFFCELSIRVETRIFQRFGLTSEMWPSAPDWDLVKLVDAQAYDLEMRVQWPGIETALPPDQRTTAPLSEGYVRIGAGPTEYVHALMCVTPNIPLTDPLWHVPESLVESLKGAG